MNDDRKVLSGMMSKWTLREKISQMMIISPDQLGENWNMTSAGENSRSTLEKYPIGGVIFFADQLHDPEQTRTMLSAFQDYSRETGMPPLFLCIDEEGGSVVRIADNPAFGVKNTGAMKYIETIGDASGVGRYIGNYLHDLGFNVDFGPDADVLTAPGKGTEFVIKLKFRIAEQLAEKASQDTACTSENSTAR